MNEADVRDAIRADADHVWWVENKRGGTFGMPDCFLSTPKGNGWAELKFGHLMKDGSIRTEASPAQLWELERLKSVGEKAVIVLGLELKKGELSLFILGPGAMEEVSGRREREEKGRRRTYKIDRNKLAAYSIETIWQTLADGNWAVASGEFIPGKRERQKFAWMENIGPKQEHFRLKGLSD